MFEVKVIQKDQWKELAQSAHAAIFNELRSSDLDRISFTLLLVQKESDAVAAYVTVQEMDAKTAYVQYGGSFPKFQGTVHVVKGFSKLIEFLKDKYQKIVTLIENNNFPMLKMYMKESFVITGIRYFKHGIFLENTYEFIS